MNKRYILAMGILAGFVMPGLIVLMAAMHDFARWGGYTTALPMLVLLVLFVVGHFVLTFMTRRRVRS